MYRRGNMERRSKIQGNTSMGRATRKTYMADEKLRDVKTYMNRGNKI